VADTGKFVMALVDAATLVIASPTVLSGAHPVVVSAVFLTNALKPKLKFASIIGSYGWGGRMVEQITGMLSGLKVEILAPVVVKGQPVKKDFEALEILASEITNKHKENKIYRI